MESVDNRDEAKVSESKFNQEIHSKIVRAGKRTYFFDVKSTRNDEYYLTITESKKRFGENGKFHYEKHKLFLYKEDFDKFADSLQEVVDFIREKQPVQYEVVEEEKQEETTEEVIPEKSFSDIEFEDI
jgi:hypothetical protein